MLKDFSAETLKNTVIDFLIGKTIKYNHILPQSRG